MAQQTTRNDVGQHAPRLAGRVCWVTGAGSGIGKAAALQLANAGATLVLTGRRTEPLQHTAREIQASGGTARVHAGDLTHARTAYEAVEIINNEFGRLDILVNNAGTNIPDRSWARMREEGVNEVINANLSSAFYCVMAVLPIMRQQKRGLLIHVASWAGRFVALGGGSAYTAAKHGVVAMSHSINAEECMNGIRSTVICPGEVDTPILDRRPRPSTPEERSRMLKPEDVADLVLYVATLPEHICLNEALITPILNRGYVAALSGNR